MSEGPVDHEGEGSFSFGFGDGSPIFRRELRLEAALGYFVKPPTTTS